MCNWAEIIIILWGRHKLNTQSIWMQSHFFNTLRTIFETLIIRFQGFWLKLDLVFPLVVRCYFEMSWDWQLLFCLEVYLKVEIVIPGRGIKFVFQVDIMKDEKVDLFLLLKYGAFRLVRTRESHPKKITTYILCCFSLPKLFHSRLTRSALKKLLLATAALCPPKFGYLYTCTSKSEPLNNNEVDGQAIANVIPSERTNTGTLGTCIPIIQKISIIDNISGVS